MLLIALHKQLREALTEAFTSEYLDLLLRFSLDVKLENIAPRGQTFEVTVLQVIEHAERAGWLQDLVEVAYLERPRNAKLAALYRTLGLAPNVSVQRGGLDATTAADGGFESVVGHQQPGLNLDEWTPAAAQVADQVCRVEDDCRPVGTGFLVGPDAVLTSDLVLDRLLSRAGRPDQFAFRFEYKVLADGTRSDGVAVGLHPTDWLIDHSPRVPTDLTCPGPPPSPDQLGYTLVRLARPVGAEPPARAVNGPPRGWVRVPKAPFQLSPHSCVVIAHYPLGEPLKITLDSEGLIGANPNHTRVWYSATTQPGSSGAPCFDDAWNLLAMHQGQDWQSRGQGVPIGLIRARLARLNKAAALGGDGN